MAFISNKREDCSLHLTYVQKEKLKDKVEDVVISLVHKVAVKIHSSKWLTESQSS